MYSIGPHYWQVIDILVRRSYICELNLESSYQHIFPEHFWCSVRPAVHLMKVDPPSFSKYDQDFVFSKRHGHIKNTLSTG